MSHFQNVNIKYHSEKQNHFRGPAVLTVNQGQPEIFAWKIFLLGVVKSSVILYSSAALISLGYLLAKDISRKNDAGPIAWRQINFHNLTWDKNYKSLSIIKTNVNVCLKLSGMCQYASLLCHMIRIYIFLSLLIPYNYGWDYFVMLYNHSLLGV